MNEPTDDQIRAEIYGAKPTGANFSIEARINRAASDREGHPVYDDVPYVLVRPQGERDGISVPATREHQLQYPNEWRAFQDRCRAITERSSLLCLPTITPSIARTLRELGLGTVELLAAAPIADRVEVTEAIEEEQEVTPPGVLPRYLELWQVIARHYVNLKHFARTGEKPRTRLEAAA